jgi:outer membrane protein OmpA-like peptidoglycan-associated protein
MKRILFSCLLLAVGTVIGQTTTSETPAIKIVKDHYTPAFGILGAGNLTKLRVEDNNTFGYDGKWGWGAGAWANFPLSNRFSIEPQVLYNQYVYSTDATATLLKDSKAGYISIPILLKLHIADWLAITAGPQFDILSSVNDDNNVYIKDDVVSTSIAGNFGLEFIPHARVVPFARYIHGFTNMDNTDNPNTVGKYYNQNFQLGLKLRLLGGKHILADSDGDGVVDKDDKCPNVVGLTRYQGCPIPDTDNDGINDEMDKCPNEAGLAKYNGCPIPDTDGDGINDETDKCPTVAGLAKYNGCPIPDTDGDGINDETDKCPTVAGLAKYNGCPVPDTDGDGINDEEDRCPEVAGIVENRGCPKIDFQAHEVTFQSGKSILLAPGKKELDVLADLLTKNPNVRVSLEGHTDNSGTDRVNDPLSAKRAEAAKAYLVSKGIDASRMETASFGSKNPVADNKTAAGKKLNRRVEVRVL